MVHFGCLSRRLRGRGRMGLTPPSASFSCCRASQRKRRGGFEVVQQMGVWGGGEHEMCQHHPARCWMLVVETAAERLAFLPAWFECSGDYDVFRCKRPSVLLLLLLLVSPLQARLQ
ncbi:unnamed protein product [Pleuronectes platessa]|uniref:Uncharacterized protein n=1 Tax=Pleuronectes platessa TaxID=8262 RepID=A0A9N7Y1X1_PLEPL|nr:unnamed protein product [Pleuronectes platessa]